jgi:beta-lactam-binding protein with PASTA domain
VNNRCQAPVFTHPRRRIRQVRVPGAIVGLAALSLCGCAGAGRTAAPHVAVTGLSPASVNGDRVIVPGVTPQYVQDGERAISSAGLRTVIAAIPPLEDVDGGVNGYSIVRQSPGAGTTVRAGSSVRVWVAMSANAGPGGVGPPRSVPDLLGMPVNLAIAAATAAGLHVTVPAVRHDLRTDAVSGQSLRPGQGVAPGEVVVLSLG